ncbi:MarR family winged helix-turn-helix transcriptional regulator [Flagellimonas sp. S3867]|uniref:MarR family winged helix-turn-helix transcriptional regulator n=1 Tax=Flagellimonas sp. S3867 TaxID=2768063 RepID=UPI00168A3093|nr:MarR family transcriptional regulator [Flagellimonas sp. S3867]
MKEGANQQMNIKDIKDVILFQLDITSKQSKIYSQRIMDDAGMGITVEQWVLLKIVQESKGLSQKEIASKSYRDPASITRTLDILERKGFVIRVRDENDRRQYGIVLTKQGKDFVDEHMALVNDMRRLTVKGFSTEEVQMLVKLLKRIKENFS